MRLPSDQEMKKSIVSVVRRHQQHIPFHLQLCFCLIGSTMQVHIAERKWKLNSSFVKHNIFTQRLFLEHFIQPLRTSYVKLKTSSGEVQEMHIFL